MIVNSLRNRLKVRLETVGGELLEEPFEPRKSFFQRYNRGGVRRRQGTRYRTGSHTRGNSFVGRGFPQRVLVKIHYKKHNSGKSLGGGGAGNLKGHLNYITRLSAGRDGERAEIFSEELAGEGQISKADFYSLCESDRHHFRMIISPEQGHEIENMQAYVREIMVRVERDLDTKLEWVSAAHYDTDNPHAHVIVRGKNERGEDLVIAPDYIAKGVRGRAEEVASELLGERSLEQVQESMRSEVTAMRVTSLDRYIAENAHEIEAEKSSQQESIAESEEQSVIRFDMSKDLEAARNEFHATLVRERLKYLASTSLARLINQNIYELSCDFRADLKEINQHREIKKHLLYVVPDEADQVHIYKLKDGEGLEIEGRVEKRGLRDELYDNKYILVRDGYENLHYVPMALNDYTERVLLGSIVKITPPVQSSGKADFNIAEIASLADGIYDRNVHMQEVLARQSDSESGNRGYIDDPESYIGHHETRLDTLLKAGIVQEAGEGRYKIPVDLVVQGEALNIQMLKKQRKQFFPSVKMLSEKPVDAQIDIHAKTFLDLEIYKQQKGYDLSYQNIDKYTLKALHNRMEWLEREGYAYRQSEDGKFVMRDDALKRLEEKELNNFKAKASEKYGIEFRSLTPAEDMKVYYKGFVNLHSGDYALIEKDNVWSVVKTKENAKYWRKNEPLKFAQSSYGLFLKRDVLNKKPDDELKRIAELLGKETQKLESGKDHSVIYVGGSNLKGGAYAVVEKDNKISMLPVSEYPKYERGTRMSLHVHAEGFADILEVKAQRDRHSARGKSKNNDQDRELGD